jgi:hypothetical protein
MNQPHHLEHIELRDGEQKVSFVKDDKIPDTGTFVGESPLLLSLFQVVVCLDCFVCGMLLLACGALLLA